MPIKRLLLVASLMLGFGLVQACAQKLEPQESCNFVQNSEQQRVSLNGQLPLRLYVHNSVPPQAYAALESAIRVWNAALNRPLVSVVAYGVDGAPTPSRDGYSILYWMNTWDPNRPTEQARTTIYWTGDQIFEADIRINDYNFDFYMGSALQFSGVDLESLFIHEIGHALGLGHISSPESVMATTLQMGHPRRDLYKIDLSSLQCEY